MGVIGEQVFEFYIIGLWLYGSLLEIKIGRVVGLEERFSDRRIVQCVYSFEFKFLNYKTKVEMGQGRGEGVEVKDEDINLGCLINKNFIFFCILV